MGRLILLGALIVFMVHLYGPGSRSLAFSISSRAGIFTHCDHRKPGCLRFFRHVDHLKPGCLELVRWPFPAGCTLLPPSPGNLAWVAPVVTMTANSKDVKEMPKARFPRRTLLGNTVNRRARGSEVRGSQDTKCSTPPTV